MAILERLAYVRAIGLDPKITERVSEWRFGQLAREGAVAPAFILDEYGPRHRRATLVAQLLELETRLSDAAVGMFDRLILGLFTKARKSVERRYQATAKEVANLMRMLSSTIEARMRNAIPSRRSTRRSAGAVCSPPSRWPPNSGGKPTKIRSSRHAINI
ncbi:hypothetical protein [Methylocystis sp. JR02]|uniref:hypothetical protein n=1 Tax=Methylocystis sp. JR02 TaxID=3046284 RepID=UPI0024BB584C|nr:hypothetical protein [Methylocystis sp. JR02]MDJ0447127.1 hypothetical protein [Methylocystis sp. JR02]